MTHTESTNLLLSQPVTTLVVIITFSSHFLKCTLSLFLLKLHKMQILFLRMFFRTVRHYNAVYMHTLYGPGHAQCTRLFVSFRFRFVRLSEM